MSEINVYKDRFYKLLISEMGNVKPLIDDTKVSNLINTVLKEATKEFPCEKTFDTVMQFQIDAHKYYYDEIAALVPIENDPEGCVIYLKGDMYSSALKNQCKWKAHPLCGGKDCFQKEAIDGIWGKNTQKAWEEIQDKPDPNDSSRTILSAYTETCRNAGRSRTQNWQIPAEMENIKLFQYWIWIIIEKDAEKNGMTKEYKSELCGGNFCLKEKAVDGFWGTNTKNMWKKYGQCYLKYFDVSDMYSDFENELKTAQSKNEEADYGYGSC